MVSFSNPEFVYILIWENHDHHCFLFKPIFLYRLRWIGYIMKPRYLKLLFTLRVWFSSGQGWVEMDTKRIRENMIGERPKYRLTTARKRCRNLQLLKRANEFPEWSCGSCVDEDDEEDDDDDESWRWLEEGGSSSSTIPHPDWQTQVLGEGIERRKENSARKKLKTKRKESKEKFGERVKHVER